MHAIAFRVVRIVFWIALSLYLGSLFAVGAIAAGPIFDTLKGLNPQVAPESNPLNWERQLPAEVFGNVLSRFSAWEGGFLVAMILAVVLESLLLRGAMLRKLWNWVRIGLLVCLVGLVAYDAAVLTPQIHAKREAWRKSGEATGTHQAEFGVLHKRAEALGHTKSYFLLGLLALTVMASTVVPPALPKKVKPIVPEPVAAGKTVA